MFAIISDIHSNLEALTTVLADIEQRGIKKIFCLGDVIGYGPNPRECLDLVMEKCELCVIGNHDFGVLYEPTNFNFSAEQASFWTRKTLEDEPEKELRDKRWQFLGSLTMRKMIESKGVGDSGNMKISLLHASPRKPINEYVFPNDVYTNPAKIKLMFERVEHICFIGHTHIPGVFFDEPDFYTPDELGDEYPLLTDEKAIINVGSVGQPRDKDNRASYAYIKDNKVHFVRLEYDIEATAKKIFDIKPLDDYQGERLREGR